MIIHKTVRAFFICFFFIFSFMAKADQSILYIVIYYVVKNSLAGKSISKSLNKINLTNIKKYEEIEENLKLNESKIISQKNVLNKVEYDKKIFTLKSEIKEYKELRNVKNKEITNKKTVAVNELLDHINKILIKYSDDNKVSLIIEKGNIIIGKKELEITNKVLKLVNNKIKKINLK